MRAMRSGATGPHVLGVLPAGIAAAVLCVLGIAEIAAMPEVVLPGGTVTLLAGALAGASQTAARSGPLMKKHNALARRLLDRQDDYLRFTRDWRVPPENNGSERDIRMAKLKQKVSGCLRTLSGARQFYTIRSDLSTAAKHGLGLFSALVMLAEGRPWNRTRHDHCRHRAAR